MNELYVGLMSGTSIDGIDAALLDLSGSKTELLGTHCEKIPARLVNAIAELATPSSSANTAHELDQLGQLDVELATLFARAANTVVEQQGFTHRDIVAIGSHGQTVRHRPPTKGPNSRPGFTLQIADPNTIAELTQISTIADFRRRDMAAGGQGAPLAPAFHTAIAPDDIETCGFLNLGGIANLTLIHQAELFSGFDTGPANGLMDAWIQRHREVPYDENGRWAASGNINQQLLDIMVGHKFFSLPAPKSTGREEFNIHWLEHTLDSLTPIQPVDVQATLAELSAVSITQSMQKLPHKPSVIYSCGGGIHNTYLIDRLRARNPSIAIETTKQLGIEGDWIEASAFAWLAKQTLCRQPIKLNGITGARGDRVLGSIFPP